MIIPKKLKVGGHEYRVLYPHIFSERSDVCAQADHATNCIRVTAQTNGGEVRPRSNVEQSFFHEVLHCVDLVYNGAKLEDEVVERISQGMYQVLRDSGMLRR